jgi:hypothetical protein
MIWNEQGKSMFGDDDGRGGGAIVLGVVVTAR